MSVSIHIVVFFFFFVIVFFPFSWSFEYISLLEPQNMCLV